MVCLDGLTGEYVSSVVALVDLDQTAKNNTLPTSLDCSVNSCGVEGSGRDSSLVGWVVYALDPRVQRRKRRLAFQKRSYLAWILTWRVRQTKMHP